MGIGASQFERPFPRLCAAIAEESPVETGNLRQPLGQFRLVLMKEEIGDVNQLGGLASNHRSDRGISIAERVHPNTTQKIQILLALRIPEVYPSSVSKQDWVALIRRHWREQRARRGHCQAGVQVSRWVRGG